MQLDPRGSGAIKLQASFPLTNSLQLWYCLIAGATGIVGQPTRLATCKQKLLEVSQYILSHGCIKTWTTEMLAITPTGTLDTTRLDEEHNVTVMHQLQDIAHLLQIAITGHSPDARAMCEQSWSATSRGPASRVLLPLVQSRSSLSINPLQDGSQHVPQQSQEQQHSRTAPLLSLQILLKISQLVGNVRIDRPDGRTAQDNLWALISVIAEGLPRYVLSKRTKPEGDLEAIKLLSMTLVRMALPVLRRAVKEKQPKPAYECARLLHALMVDVTQPIIDSVAEEVINAGKSHQRLL